MEATNSPAKNAKECRKKLHRIDDSDEDIDCESSNRSTFENIAANKRDDGATTSNYSRSGEA